MINIKCFATGLALVILQVSPALADVSRLVGKWQTQNESIIEFKSAGKNVEGRLIKITPGLQKRGFSVGDVVAHQAESDGDWVKFQLAVRTLEPHPECPAAFVTFEGKFSEGRSQLEGFRHSVELPSGDVDSCRYSQSPSFVDEVFLRVDNDPHLDEYTTKFNGQFSLSSGEKGKSHANVTAELGKGFTGDIVYASDTMMAAIYADSTTGVTFEEVVAFNSTGEIGYDERLPGPTQEAVQKFIEIKALQSAVIAAGDPPGEGRNLARQPVILCAKAHDPNPGKSLYLAGSFGLKGELTVYFQQMHKEVITQDKKTTTRWVIDKKYPAKVIGRQANGITVQIPDVEGRIYIVVKAGDMESVPYKYKVLRKGREPSLQRRAKERVLCQLLDQVMLNDTSGEIARVFHVFTRKEGKFRYRIGSKSTKVKVNGKRVSMRWMFHLDGEFINGYKMGVFNLGVTLVPKGQEKAFLDDPDHPLSDPIKLIQIRTGKDEDNGKQYYDVRIFNDGLSSLVGVRWNKKTRKLTLSDLAGVDLKKLGLKMGWDSKKEQIFFKVKNKLGELEILGNGEGGSAKFTEFEDRVYLDHLHRFSLTSKTQGDKVYTVIKNDIYLGKKDTSKKLLELELAYDSTVPAGEPNPNVDAKIVLRDYVRDKNNALVPGKSISLQAGMREHKLGKLDVDLTAVHERDSYTLGFGYLRNIPGSTVPNQRRWETRLGLQNRFADGDVKIRSLATMQLDTRKSIVDAMTIRLAAKAKIDKGLKWGLQVDGAYTRQRRPTRGESWELNVTGSAEKAKIEGFIRLQYRESSNEKDLSIFGGVELGGAVEGALKLFDAKKYKKNEWKLYDN